MTPSIQLETACASCERVSVRDVAERLVAAVLLLLFSPVLLSLIVAVLVCSRRAPLIVHRRVGQNGRELWVWKLRTLWSGRAGSGIHLVERIADDEGPKLKGPSDGRVGNRLAGFCRHHSIDELPQLINVALGEMSFVGPRPVTHREVIELFGPAAAEILRVKPGLTGLWQVCGRNRLSPAQRRRLDARLARRCSGALYMGILLRTVPEVVGGRNTW